MGLPVVPFGYGKAGSREGAYRLPPDQRSSRTRSTNFLGVRTSQVGPVTDPADASGQAVPGLGLLPQPRRPPRPWQPGSARGPGTWHLACLPS